MMEELHHVHGGMTLDAPLYEDPGVHSFNSFAPYQQLPYHASPCMSWSTTDPTLSLNDQSWLNREKAPLSWQTDMGYLHQGMHQSHAGFSTVGQLDVMAALNADPYNASVNELSQWLQVYSLYQDHYGVSIPPFVPDTTGSQPNYLLTSSSECLQVVSSSGSDSLSTTETWRSETSGGFAPNYEQVLPNFNESSSVSLGRDTRDCSYQPQKQQLDIMQQDSVSVYPLQDSWIQNQLQADIGRSNPLTLSALTHDVTSFDMLTSTSSTAHPPFKRPRTWHQALQQGSAENDHLQFALASKTNRKLDVSAGPLSRPIPTRDMKTPARQVSLQGKFSANLDLFGPGTSAFQKRLNLQEDGRLSNGKVTVTSIEPQSVAARHRRKKISERIRVLEKLIPGGNKMDTATMLDEAIEYVKFLQLQVQILESESLSDIPVPAATSTQSLSGKGSSNNVKDGLKRKMEAGSGGDLSAALSLRAATSPLILSEVLQQQLFKQKLCLVSIRQCPPRSASTPALAPSVLRKK